MSINPILAQKFKRRCRRWTLFTVGILVLSLAFSLWRDWITTYPLDVPIMLHQAQTIDEPLEIRAPDYNRLIIRFTDLNRRTLDALATFDKAHVLPPVTVRWKLLTADGVVIDQGDAHTGKVAGWASDVVDHELGVVHYPQLTGHYRFQAQVDSPDHAYSQINAHLMLDAYPKSARDWRFELLYSGMYAQALVLWPLVVLGGLFMIYNAVAWWRFRS
ncbi:hypothetical protein [Pseudomonas fluorescens]